MAWQTGAEILLDTYRWQSHRKRAADVTVIWNLCLEQTTLVTACEVIMTNCLKREQFIDLRDVGEFRRDVNKS